MNYLIGLQGMKVGTGPFLVFSPCSVNLSSILYRDTVLFCFFFFLPTFKIGIAEMTIFLGCFLIPVISPVPLPQVSFFHRKQLLLLFIVFRSFFSL